MNLSLLFCSENHCKELFMKIEITAIKYETVNGKKTGKSFRFRLDPRKMAASCKTEKSLRKKIIDEHVAKSGVFRKDELKDVELKMKDFVAEWKKQLKIVKAEEEAKHEVSRNNPGSSVTPNEIKRPGADEVFVFGSNEQGLHYSGAAKDAVERFGAIMGQGNGMQGMSCAIPSMSGLEVMGEYVKQFCDSAKAHPEKRFLVTPIGCGSAGHTAAQVAPLFKCCREIDNVCLPASFWQVIGTPASKQYDLERFVTAQEIAYPIALEEIRSGRKKSHWIWYIFPQQKGKKDELGHSKNSKYYGLDGIDDACAYLAHPILETRFREICEVLLTHAGKRPIDYIMGSHTDVLKLQTSMKLFDKVAPNDVFKKVLEAFF